MQDTQYINHNYSENREVCVFSNYNFYQLVEGEQESVSVDVANEILGNHSDKLSSLFQGHILKSLKDGETSGNHEITEKLTISSGEEEFILELDWAVSEENILSKLNQHHIENFEYDVDVEVEVEVNIELNEDSEEIENDDIDFSGAVDYMTSDIEGEVESGETEGNIDNFHFSGFSYNINWKII